MNDDRTRATTKNIAVLADVHYGPSPTPPIIGSELGAILLRRAVERLNRFVQPQLVVVFGDLINSSTSPRALDALRELRDILNHLTCPYFVIRGPHDPETRLFYSIMPRPAPLSDVGGMRVLCFDDQDHHGHSARRSSEDLLRLRAARRDNFSGSVLVLQHMPVMPKGRGPDHSHENLGEVLDANEAAKVTLSIGGAGHNGAGIVRSGHTSYVVNDVLSKSPYAYGVITLDGDGDAKLERQTLAMPESCQLMDLHGHTQMAYCAGDVRADWSVRVAEAMGLRAIALTEHLGHLYFNRADFNSGQCCQTGIRSAKHDDERVRDYFQLVHKSRTEFPVRLGMEIDTDYDGVPIIRREHRSELDWAVGAIHFIPPAARNNQDEFVGAFQKLTEGICGSGIDVLAHPFRIFRRQRREVPPRLYPWLVGILKGTGVAAEINFHTNQPHVEFVRMCLESGVKLTFGSDAHDLWEVGEFFGHLQLLKELGIHDDVNDYLVEPPTAKFPTAATA